MATLVKEQVRLLSGCAVTSCVNVVRGSSRDTLTDATVDQPSSLCATVAIRQHRIAREDARWQGATSTYRYHHCRDWRAIIRRLPLRSLPSGTRVPIVDDLPLFASLASPWQQLLIAAQNEMYERQGDWLLLSYRPRWWLGMPRELVIGADRFTLGSKNVLTSDQAHGNCS